MKTHIRLKNLNELCEQSQKTKATIAREMGISPQQLNNIIHEHRPMPLRLVVPFCKAVGCDPNYLFGWENRICRLPLNGGIPILDDEMQREDGE